MPGILERGQASSLHRQTAGLPTEYPHTAAVRADAAAWKQEKQREEVLAVCQSKQLRVPKTADTSEEPP